MSASERIETLQNEIVEAKDRLDELQDADVYDSAEIERTIGEIETKQTELTQRQKAEAMRAGNGRAASGFTVPALREKAKTTLVTGDRRPLGQKEIDPFDLFVRGVVCQVHSIITNKSVDEVLAKRYPGHADTEVVTKAAVAGATTTAAGWAAELVETSMQGFMSALTPASVFPSLSASGLALSFGPNAGSIKIPSRAATPSISGSFVGEASPVPVRRLGLTSKTLLPHKLGVISVFSREIAKYSNPAIEGIIREAIIADTSITVDTLLLDATAGSAVRPAGLTNGVATLTPTANGGYAAVIGDLQKLIGAMTANNRSIGNLRLLMNPAQDLSLALLPGPGNTGFGWSEQFMSRFSPIVSSTIPVGDVYLIDASDFVSSNGSPEFDLSEEAVLHMEDTTPLQIGTTGSPNTVAAPVQSMFQTAQVAIRMLWDLTWNTRRTGAIAWIDNVTW